MPGVKRKASTAPGEKRPIKLKKQSTSVSVDRAVPTLKQKTSKLKTTQVCKPSTAPRKKAGESKTTKSVPALPRFPTLVPTKPDKDQTAFVFSVSPGTSSLKKDAISDTGGVPELRKESTKRVSMDDNSDCKASNMEKSVLTLSSGSYVGRIMNNEGRDSMLPSLESMARYEGRPKPKISTTPFTWDMTDADPSPVRQSLYDVNAVLHLLDQESSPAKSGCEMSDDDSDAPPVLEAQVYEASCGDYDEDATLPTLMCMGTPSKSQSKSPRKMTGGPREIVFSFDTTGSMYNYTEEARDRMRELMNRVHEDMPSIRLAFVAHGDYYDLANDRYLIKWIDFGASVDEVDTFFENLPITHGGDADECYELVLRKVRESLSWSVGSQRSLVMIGDSDPHEPGYTFDDFVNDIDWRKETRLLNEMGVRIYALQVGYTSNFYKQIAQMTGGAHLRIENTDFTYDTLISICLREGSLRHLKAYEHEVRTAAKKSGSNGGVLDLELERLFSSLKNIADNKSLKQRERENKIKARILEMSTNPNASIGIKRPSTDIGGDSEKKKPNMSSKGASKLPEKLSKSASASIIDSPKKLAGSSKKPKLTNVKDNKKEGKKMLMEKAKKVPKIKTPATKQMTQKVKKLVTEKKKEVKSSGKSSLKIQGKGTENGTGVGKSKMTSDKVKKPVGRPRKGGEKSGAKLKKGQILKGKSSKKTESIKSSGKSTKKTETSKSPGRPRKTAEIAKSGEKPKRGETTKSSGKPSKKAESLKSVKALKKAVKLKSKLSNKGKSSKLSGKSNKSAKSAEKHVKKEKSKVSTKVSPKKTDNSLKSPSAIVKRIVTAKLKRVGKSGAITKVKIPKKSPTASKKKISTTPSKKQGSTEDAKKVKVGASKVASDKKITNLKKSEIKTKLSKYKSAKEVQEEKKAERALKKTKKSDVTAAKKGGSGKTTGQPKTKSKDTSKPKTPNKSKTSPPKQSSKPSSNKKSSPEKKSSVKTPKKDKGDNTEPRESISGSKFNTGPLSNVRWSPWTAIISPTSGGADWSKSHSWCSGHCNGGLYKGDAVTQALYEAAVVPPGSNNKYAVCYVAVEGVPSSMVWNCFLTAPVRRQVERVIKAKGSIYVRRGIIAGRSRDSLLKAEDYIKDNFDYAWRGTRQSTDIRKEGFLVTAH